MKDAMVSPELKFVAWGIVIIYVLVIAIIAIHGQGLLIA